MEKKLVIMSHYDVLLYTYPGCYLKRVVSQFFYRHGNLKYLNSHGIQIIPITNFIEDMELRFRIMDYNLAQDLANNDDINLMNIYHDSMEKFISKVIDSNEYDGCFILAVEMYCLDFLYQHASLLQSKNIKVLFYYNEFHHFTTTNHHLTLQELFQKSKNELPFSDPRLEFVWKILTSTDYLQSRNIYQEKVIKYHVPTPDTIYSMYTPATIPNRIQKILLVSDPWMNPMATHLSHILSNRIFKHHQIASQYYQKLENHIYSNPIDDIKLNDMFGIYRKIGKYAGAIVTFIKSPLDYIPIMIFKVISTGTLLFCEENTKLNELGLIPFEHYVPINYDSMIDINYLSQFLGTENGILIARNGYNHMQQLHQSKKTLDFFIEMLTPV